MKNNLLTWFVGSLLTVANATQTTALAQEPDDFAHTIVPILRAHCVECHGGREAKGSFSLNTRQLLVDSGFVIPGKPDESRLMELVRSEDPEQQMPPRDHKRVPVGDQKKLEEWIRQGLSWDDGLTFAPVAWEPPLEPRRPDLPDALPGRDHPVDRILDHWLSEHGQAALQPIDDATFLRRVSLDLVGLLPTPERVDQFLADRAPDKRSRYVRELLDDRISYADHWLTFFNDLLRNDYSGTGFITGGRQQVSGWLYDALLTNKPFDQFARELIAPPTPASQGYIDGIRWRGEVSAGQTVEIQFAQSVAQSFLGINMKCASCHDSFIDRWKLEEAYGLASVYSSQPLQIHRCDKPTGRTSTASWMFPQLGQIDPAAPKEERLRQLAVLMTHPQNGRFQRTIVNRLWYRMMGRGIVHPLDAMQSPPWNEDLLDHLATELTDHQYDLKHVLYHIATSEAYQSQTTARTSAADVEWRGPVTRRMTAEQFLDGIWQITSAGPATSEAPVFRASVDSKLAGELEFRGQWIWGASASTGQVPAAGEAISLRRTFALDAPLREGGAVVTCDNGFVLFVNGREVARGDDWSQPVAINLKGLLKKGDNTILATATNAGSGPNAAGFFFEARGTLDNEAVFSLVSDDQWKWNEKTATVREGRASAIQGNWKPVTVLNALDVWTNAVNTQGRNLMAQALSGDLKMVRASLMKNDFLMRSLGRPHREQIVSMRPDELTTLEAIDLANGPVLSGYLNKGARRLSEQWQADRDGLIRYVFRYALTRNPTDKEFQILRESISSEPKPEETEDLLWAILMTPEYFLIR